MMVQHVQRQAGQINQVLLVLLAFCLPLSTSALTVAAFLLMAGWLVEGGFRQKWQEIYTSPLCIAVFLYVGVLLIGLGWSNHLQSGFAVIEQQLKILLLPIFLTTVRREYRWLYLGAFIAGITVVMLSSYLAWFGLLQYADVTTTHLIKKTFHVVYNPMLALAIYLLMHQLLWQQISGRWRWCLIALVALMIFNMFITEGRAGQLVFFVLMAVLLIQYFRKNIVVGACLILVLLPLVFAGVYRGSPVFRDRVDQARQEIEQFQTNPATSVGLRLLYWKNSWRIIANAPWFGEGTGDFFAAYARINFLFSRSMPFTDNPHNQYIYILVQVGMLGLAALLAPFAVQIYLAWRMQDGWGRTRLAFPLFFLVIMVTESYLIIYETGFLFSLLSAVLYKTRESQSTSGFQAANAEAPGRCWLILSYRANIPGSACSQHIDDRLPILEKAGIVPLLLTGPVGKRYTRYHHYRTWSLAPSGIRFEVRHFLRKRLRHRWQFKLAETALLLPVFPLYLVEKVLVNLESEWSWFFTASIRGLLLQRRYRPEVVYSTGGSASAHVAALIINRVSGLFWIAETQDPLVHDRDWQRSRLVFSLYCWLEKRIAATCNAFVFLTAQAMENAGNRIGTPFPGRVIYPGAPLFSGAGGTYCKGKVFRFAHFGSLAGSRNLLVFLQALAPILQRTPDLRQTVCVDLYGSLDAASHALVQQLDLASLVQFHGLIDRQKALAAMRRADCLLLIQNTSYFSTETIPSKVYEYLCSGRPILGLIHNSRELTLLLQQYGHYVAAADDPVAVGKSIKALLNAYATTDFVPVLHERMDITLESAVQSLIDLAPGAAQSAKVSHACPDQGGATASG